jgi:hypothetical protein
MKRISLLFIAVATLSGAAAFTASAPETTAQEASPVFVKTIPRGYRDWRVVSVAHEAGDLNDIRAVLGNDIAIKAYRDGKIPFPEGSIVGRDQSFVAGAPTDSYLQFMVKDSKKYAATGGWGYSSFDMNGKPSDETSLKTCYPCHQKIQDRDFVFSRYTK